jgi:uncharacterized protein YecT (DUF1311 family)
MISAIIFSLCVIQNAFASNYDMKGCDGGTIKDGQAAMNICSGNKYNKADAKMNKQYKQLLTQLKTKESKERLKAAQRAWLKYRDADCLYYNGAPEDGGSSYIQLDTMCKYRHTRQRIEELERFLNCTQQGCPN